MSVRFLFAADARLERSGSNRELTFINTCIAAKRYGATMLLRLEN